MWRWTGGLGCCGGGTGFGLGWWGILNFAFGLLILVIGIFVAVWIVRGLLGSNRRSWSAGSGLTTPESILKERYARGEITREEYLERLRDIRGEFGAGPGGS